MTPSLQQSSQGRVIAVDLFRGLTMFLLVAEGAHIYHALTDLFPEQSLLGQLVLQFHHHPWNGLRFWDLIQPYFMFIVGVAMWFSVNKRQDRGDSRAQVTRHIVRRCLILLAFGVTLHIGYNRKLVWELWNVLSQLSVTILIAYALMRLPTRTQLIISLGLLLLTEILYRTFGVEGYNQPFVKDHNFGSYMDRVLMGKINPGGGWVAINCIPTAAHTIWGVLAGKLLASSISQKEKLQQLLIAGGIGVVLGYGLDWGGITPIIKRICTSSFVLVSGGWSLLTLALFYWLIDVRGWKRGVWFFSVVGMNSIFIYMFMNTVGPQWMRGFVKIFTEGIFAPLGMGEAGVELVNALGVLAIAWGLCYWLYKKGIFFKI